MSAIGRTLNVLMWLVCCVAGFISLAKGNWTDAIQLFALVVIMLNSSASIEVGSRK